METQHAQLREKRQFTALPMPEEVIKMLDAMAAKDGITRATNLFEKKDSMDDADRPPLLVEDNESDDENDETVKGPSRLTLENEG